VENTVARGSIVDDALVVPKDSNAFPCCDWKLLERGEERYNIFCSPCHGLQGDGNGMIAMRGVKRPPTYHQDRLRQSPNGYFYDVITNALARCIATPRRFPAGPRASLLTSVPFSSAVTRGTELPRTFVKS